MMDVSLKDLLFREKQPSIRSQIGPNHNQLPLQCYGPHQVQEKCFSGSVGAWASIGWFGCASPALLLLLQEPLKKLYAEVSSLKQKAGSFVNAVDVIVGHQCFSMCSTITSVPRK